MDTDGLVLIWQLIHLGVYLPAHGHGLPNKNQETEEYQQFTLESNHRLT